MVEVETLLSTLPSAWDDAVLTQTLAARPQTSVAPTLWRAPTSVPSSNSDIQDFGITERDPFGSNVSMAVTPPMASHGDMTGQTVGRYVLHERVARGKSGDLYKAWDPVRSTLVGVKVVHARDAQARERLLRGGRVWLTPHLNKRAAAATSAVTSTP